MKRGPRGANHGTGMAQLDQASIRARLERLRQVFGVDTQGAMAARLGVEFQTYNKAETFSLSKDIAIRICQRFPGVTLDWLFFGKVDGMPVALAITLAELAS